MDEEITALHDNVLELERENEQLRNRVEELENAMDDVYRTAKGVL